MPSRGNEVGPSQGRTKLGARKEHSSKMDILFEQEHIGSAREFLDCDCQISEVENRLGTRYLEELHTIPGGPNGRCGARKRESK